MNQEITITEPKSSVVTPAWMAHGMAVGLFLLLQLLSSLFPNFILRGFAYPAGWLAAKFWGAPSELQSNGELAIHHTNIPLSVTEACSGFTFFSILIGMFIGFACHQFSRRDWIRKTAPWLLGIYLVGVLANACRIIASVEARIATDTLFPANYQSILHTAIGTLIFLPTAIFFWISLKYLHGRTYINR